MNVQCSIQVTSLVEMQKNTSAAKTPFASWSRWTLVPASGDRARMVQFHICQTNLQCCSCPAGPKQLCGSLCLLRCTLWNFRTKACLSHRFYQFCFNQSCYPSWSLVGKPTMLALASTLPDGRDWATRAWPDSNSCYFSRKMLESNYLLLCSHNYCKPSAECIPGIRYSSHIPRPNGAPSIHSIRG